MRQKALLLNRMFSCDGWICLQCRKDDRTAAEVGYSTSSKQLAIQVKELLLSCGILSRILTKKTYRRLNYNVIIAKHAEIAKFVNIIGDLIKPNGIEISNAIKAAIQTKTTHGFDDGVPTSIAKQYGLTGWFPYETVSIEKLRLLAQTNIKLDAIANSDIKWEKIKSITPIPEDLTYDLEVEGTHNYIANGIITHNSEILAVAFPIWISLFKRDQNILIVTNAMHLSTDILRRLKNHIYGNELLSQLKGRTWTKTSIITSTNCKIECKPYSNTVRGGAYHYVLPDEAGTYEDKDIFYSAIIPTVAKTSGHVCVIGTPMS
jgi:hypothetical protein